jgi:hypothetical protein
MRVHRRDARVLHPDAVLFVEGGQRHVWCGLVFRKGALDGVRIEGCGGVLEAVHNEFLTHIRSQAQEKLLLDR